MQVGQTLRSDVRFSLAQEAQEVTVSAAGVLLESETASVGQVVSQQLVENLPLNGQRFMQLAVLGSGVTPSFQTRTSEANSGTGRTDMVIHISGGRGDANSYLIDGVETRNVQLGPPSVLLSPAAIHEFRVQKNMFEARYGQESGNVSMVTKSGSNTFHGSVYEFIRNDRLDAANFFDNFFGREKPPYRQNQFGAAVGGPIWKNKVFFFGNYEGFRVRQGNTLGALVPTPAQLNGDLSGLPSAKKDPLTGQPAILNPFTGEAFPNNQIPPEMLSRIATRFTQYIPEPNTNIGGQNLAVSPSTRRNDDQFTIRVDANLGPNDTLSGRYISFDSDLLIPGIAPFYGTEFPYRGQVTSLEETHLFSANVINVFRVGYNRSVNLIGWESTPNSIAEELGIRNRQQVPLEFGLPTFVIAGFSNLGATLFKGGGVDNIYQLSDEVNWSRGRHDVSFGADIRRVQFQFIAGAFPTGLFVFDGRYSGNALGDFLLGTASLAATQGGLSVGNWRSTSLNFFVQDNFKLSPRLTLNLGLRYEYDQPIYEINGKEGFFDARQQRLIVRVPRSFSPIQLPDSAVFDPSFRRGIWEPDKNNWAPRFGLAYRLADDTVLRGGYGIFYSKTQGNELQGKINSPPMVFSINLLGSLTTPNLVIDRDAFPSPAELQFGTLSPFSVDPREPYALFSAMESLSAAPLG